MTHHHINSSQSRHRSISQNLVRDPVTESRPYPSGPVDPDTLDSGPRVTSLPHSTPKVVRLVYDDSMMMMTMSLSTVQFTKETSVHGNQTSRSDLGKFSRQSVYSKTSNSFKSEGNPSLLIGHRVNPQEKSRPRKLTRPPVFAVCKSRRPD